MDDDSDLGPAMQALSERQRLFVMALVEMPGCSHAKAARHAGYSDHLDAAKVRGHHLAQSPAVQAAIHEVTSRRIRSHSLMAADVVIKMAMNPKVSASERLKAAGMLLDRSGFAAVQNINVNKTTTDRTGKAIMERIQALAQRHGLDAGKLLEGPEVGIPATVDAEFSEVKDD